VPQRDGETELGWRLRLVNEAAGKPSMRKLGELALARNRSLSRGSISNLLRSCGSPTWGTVYAFVEACAVLVKRRRRSPGAGEPPVPAETLGLLPDDTVDENFWHDLYDRSSPGRKRTTASAPARLSRIPYRLPPPLSHYVPRQLIVDRLTTALLREPEPDGRAVVIAVAGMGGAGKSTVARAAAADPDVRARFRDGVVWVQVGPRPDLATLHRSVAREFGVDLPPQAEAETDLHGMLADRAVLLVLDNVWDLAVVRGFDLASPHACVVVTSRSLDAVYDDAEVVDVPLLEPEAATTLMATYAEQDPAELPAQARKVLACCGGLPLALAAVGAMVQEGHRWADIAARLDRRSVPSLPIRFRQHDELDVTDVLAVSVEMLTEYAQTAYLDLGVLAESAPIPASSVLRLWTMRGVDDVDGRELLLMLARRNLLTHDLIQDTVELHDLLTSLVLTTRPSEARREQTLGFVRSYLDQWGGLGRALPGLLVINPEDPDQRYGFSTLIRWLDQADDEPTIHGLLALSVTSPTGRGLPEYQSHLWFRTYEAIGEPSGLMRDLRLVRDRLRRRWNAPRPADLAYEWRYLLMTAALVETAARTPPQIAAALLRRDYWTPRVALTYVDMVTEPDQKIELLKSIVEQLPTEAAGQALAMVQSLVRDADAVPDKQAGGWSWRKQSLNTIVAHLAGMLPDDRLREMLELVARMGDHWSFAALASRLDDDLVGAALDRTEIWTGWDAVHRLRLLEPLLTPRTARKAAALALSLPPQDRLEALVPLLQHLSADEAEAALIAEIAGAGQGDRDPWLQWRILKRTIGRLPTQLVTPLMEHIEEIDDEGQRALILAHIVRQLTGLAALRAWKTAFTLSSRCKYPEMCAEVLGLLAADVPSDDDDVLAEFLTAAMEVARKRRADSARFFRGRDGFSHHWGDHFGFGSAYLLEDVSRDLPAPEKAASLLIAVHDRATPDLRVHLATMAWRFSEQVPQPANRFRLQVELALLPGASLDSDRERFLLMSAQVVADPFERAFPLIDLAAAGSRAAADAAAQIASACEPWQRARMFPALARLAAPGTGQVDLWSAALDAIRADSDEDRRGFDLAKVIADLPSALHAQAREIFVSLSADDRFRVRWALATAPGSMRRHLVAATAEAVGISDPYQRALALSEIASRCTEISEQRRWANEALCTAQFADEHWKFAVAVKQAAAHLPTAEAETAIEAALSEMLAQAVDDRDFGSRAAVDGIRTLITSVSAPVLLQHEVAIRGALHDPDTLIALDVVLAKAGDRSRERLWSALRLARQSTGAKRSNHLAQIAPVLPDTDRETLLAEEVNFVRETTPLLERLAALRALLPVMTDQQAIDEALRFVDSVDTQTLARARLAEIASAKDRTNHRFFSLSAVLPYLGPDERKVCQQLVGAEPDPNLRVDLLLDLARKSTGPDRTAILRDATAAARAVNQPDQRIKQLLSVAALLNPVSGDRLRVEALRVAERIPTVTVRTKVLNDLIERLPAAVLPYALRVGRSGNVREASRSWWSPVAHHGDQSSLEVVAALVADQPHQAAQLLVSLAPRLPEALISRAEELAMSLSEPYSSIRATVAVLATRNETIDDDAAVLHQLGRVSHPRFKIRALLLLATISAPAAAQQLSEIALTSLSELGLNDDERLQLLTSVLTGRTGPVLTGPALTEAIRLASATAVDHRRFIAWARLLPCLPVGKQRAVLREQLLDTAARLDPARAQRLLARLVRFCPPGLDADLADLGNPILEAKVLLALHAEGRVPAATVDWIGLVDTVTRIADASERATLLVSVACQIPAALLDHLLPADSRLATADQQFRLLLAVVRRRPHPEWARDWAPLAELAAGLGRSQVGAVLTAAADSSQTDHLERAWEDCRSWWP